MRRKRQKIWAPMTPRPPAVNPLEKQLIVEVCEAFIANILKPRFLPAIRPTTFNYPIDIHGDWRAGRYRFMQRYRSGHPNREVDEFDAPFARIDRMGPDRFDIYWMRHTGAWYLLHTGKTLAEAFHILETDNVLFPT